MNEKQQRLLDELFIILNNPKNDLSNYHDGCMGDWQILDKNKLIVDIIHFVESNLCKNYLLKD